MKKRHFDVETDGFYGAYWKCKTDSDYEIYTSYGAAYERISTHMQIRVCNLCARNSFRFSRKYVKDNVTSGFWILYENGISGGKKISERMPESTFGY